MSLLTCRACTCTYAASVVACPQCGAPETLEEREMPKTTVHGGPSNAADLPDLTAGGIVGAPGVVELTAEDGPLVPVADVPPHDPPPVDSAPDVPDPKSEGVEPDAGPATVDEPVKRRTRKA